MRYRKAVPAYGDRRSINKFFLIPITLPVSFSNNLVETRWLESGTYIEEFMKLKGRDDWVPIHWLSIKE